MKQKSLPTRSSSSPLRIVVLGVGGIGSTFAFQLAGQGQHDVTVVARPGSARLRQLQRDEAIVNVVGKSVKVRVTDTLDEAVPYDLVIVTLLAHQVEAVLPALGRSAAKCIQFMFNQFEPERLLEAVGAGRCSFGMPFVQASLDGEGRLSASIGAGGQKSKMNRQEWVDVFSAAGLPAALETEMLLWLRCHVPLCVAFESVSDAAVRRGRGVSWQQSLVLARGVRESFTLIERLGFELYPPGKAFLRRSPAGVAAGMLWSLSRVKSFRRPSPIKIGTFQGKDIHIVSLADGIVTSGSAHNPRYEKQP